MKYNLKFWIGCALVSLAIGPFVYFHYRAEDAIQYFDGRYDVLDVMAACSLTLPILLSISFSPRFARFCAKDVNRVAETISTARYTSCIAALALMWCLVVWIFNRHTS